MPQPIDTYRRTQQDRDDERALDVGHAHRVSATILLEHLDVRGMRVHVQRAAFVVADVNRSRARDEIYSIDPKTSTWTRWETGYRIDSVRMAGRRLVAASLYDGVLVEPDTSRVETSQR